MQMPGQTSSSWAPLAPLVAAVLVLGAVPSGAADCAQIPGAAALLQPGFIILLGELHGTVEAPAAVSSLACAALAREVPVVVALELPGSEQDRIDDFLAGEIDREGLLAGGFWQRDYQDGRTSRAMARLLGELRELRRRPESKADLRVITIDDPGAAAGRDRVMAERIAAVSGESGKAVLISLTGNLHNRLTRGTRFNPAQEPMGYLLRQLRPEAVIHSLNLTYESGSAWVCNGSTAGSCGALKLKGGAARQPGVLSSPAADGPFTGSLHLGPISASPPARDDEGRDRILGAAREIFAAARYCTLASTGEDGQPQARIVDPFPIEADSSIWIGTNNLTRKVGQLRADPRATLLCFDQETLAYVSFLGRAELVNDPAEKAARFKPEWTAFYKDGSRGDDYLLIRLRPARIEVVSPGHDLMNDPVNWRPPAIDLR